MKKIFYLVVTLCCLYACSNDVNYSISEEDDLNRPISRSAGDSKYDVLGFGYDITGDYLHPESVKNPVLDIQKYDSENDARIISGTSSYGYDKFFYGYSAEDYRKDVVTNTKATFTLGDGADKSEGAFSGNITANPNLKDSYSYSTKYSFASLDAVRNRKYIRINDDISYLRHYLSNEFLRDLNEFSADYIVKKYGTHVLTDFILGGRYRVIFRSVINHTENTSTKKITVASGFKAVLKKIGLGVNIDSTVETDETLIQDNTSKELYVQYFGGNGTNIRYDLEKGMPSSIDVSAWENQIKLENATLTNVNWEETYPIYEFISDPIKKAAVKSAVQKYINDKQITILDIIPLYTYYCENKKGDHYVTTKSDIDQRYSGWKLIGIEGYVLRNNLQGAIPLYEYCNDKDLDHYTTSSSNINIKYPIYQKKGLCGYIYPKTMNNTLPLYEYYHSGNVDHYNSSRNDITQLFTGWSLQNPSICGYIYSPN